VPELASDALREVERIAWARALDDPDRQHWRDRQEGQDRQDGQDGQNRQDGRDRQDWRHGQRGASIAGQLEGCGPWVARARRSGLRRTLGARAVFIWRIGCENGCRALIESSIVPTSVELHGEWPRDHKGLASRLQHATLELRSVIDDHARDWRRAVEQVARGFWTTRLLRERAIAALRRIDSDALFQPGLFDRRAERAHRHEVDASAGGKRDREARLAALEQMAIVTDGAPELLLVLLP
jgi:hypothetical protein